MRTPTVAPPVSNALNLGLGWCKSAGMEARDLVPVLDLPREERVRLLAEHYAGAGWRSPEAKAERMADNSLALLFGEAGGVLEALRGGMGVPELSRALGVASNSMYEWLLRYAPEEWSSLSAGRAVGRLDEADELLDRASDKVEVSRAAVMQRGAQWILERVASRVYGVKGGGGGNRVVVVVDRSCGGQVEVGGGEVFDSGEGCGSSGGRIAELGGY